MKKPTFIYEGREIKNDEPEGHEQLFLALEMEYQYRPLSLAAKEFYRKQREKFYNTKSK